MNYDHMMIAWPTEDEITAMKSEIAAMKPSSDEHKLSAQVPSGDSHIETLRSDNT